MLAGLLKVLDIAGAVVTADAMHCQRETAQTIRERGGHYILTVKNNQPTLRRRVKALPWKDIPTLAASRERGHGRQDPHAQSDRVGQWDRVSWCGAGIAAEPHSHRPLHRQANSRGRVRDHQPDRR
jgi:hypothetical protein